MLEFSQYLENYLWLNFNPDASPAHVMSIVYMVNEKFRERVPAWVPFQKKPENFQVLFKKVMELSLLDNIVGKKDDNSDGIKISLKEQTALLVFLGHCFMSMEVKLVRDYVQKLVSLSMWESLLESRRDHELKTIPRWKKILESYPKERCKGNR
jgi:intron-binding protein aquarius